MNKLGTSDGPGGSMESSQQQQQHQQYQQQQQPNAQQSQQNPGLQSMTVYLNRHTGLDRTCRVRFNIRVGGSSSSTGKKTTI